MCPVVNVQAMINEIAANILIKEKNSRDWALQLEFISTPEPKRNKQETRRNEKQKDGIRCLDLLQLMTMISFWSFKLH